MIKAIRQSKAFAYVLLILVAGYALYSVSAHQSQRLYQTQIESCDRGNSLRAESNQRIPAQKAETRVLRLFLTAAAKARLENYRATGQRADLQASQAYSAYVRELTRSVHFSPIPIINCLKVIKKP